MAAVQQRHPQTDGDGGGALEAALAAVARRLRLARWVRHASRGALLATAVSLAAVGLDHFDLLPDWLPVPAVIAGAFALGVAAGTATAYLRPIPAMAVARLAETRLGLKERLSSALEFEQKSGLSDDPEAVFFRRLQRQDAREFAQRLKATEAAPLTLSWETKALPPALVTLALALILPSLPFFLPPGALAERAAVRKEGTKLEQVARVLQKQAEAQNLPATRHAAQTMQQLGRRMAGGHLDKQRAMVRMAQLTRQMQAQQRQLAQQAGQAAAGGGKSLAQAGQQLAASLQNPPPSGQNGQGASKSQGATAAGSKSTGAQPGHAAGAHAAGAGAHGFNVPARSKPGDRSAQNPQGSPNGAQATPEVRQAAQAMQQNDAATLSQQLRQLARKTENGQLSPTRQQQASQDLQKLADALNGAQMPQTQQHAQAAAQALARGDKQTAASEMRQAADAAEREAQQRADAQGMQSAQNSLQNGQGEMAGAQDPGDIPDAPPGQGQGDQPGKNSGQGQGDGSPAGTIPADAHPSNGGRGGGRGKPDTTYHKGVKPNGRLVQKPGVGKDAPHWLDPHFDPTKNPRYARLYFGKPQTAGPSQAGPARKARPGEDAGPVHSVVPYYNTVVGARRTAESTMDREDIPPAYKKDVADYFNSLQPRTAPSPAAGGGGAAAR